LKATAADRRMIVPRENGIEGALVSDAVYPANSLQDVTAHFRGVSMLAPLSRTTPAVASPVGPDIAEVRGQARAKRALEIAAAGGHNLLFTGPPGTGKSMLAARLPGILPPMSEAEALETAAIDSLLNHPPALDRWCLRPFRAPHHTASAAALVGGGSTPRPGEVSRAHNGVLFLDELPEFSRNVLEVLREPMEAGHITISRASRQDDFPAAFQLVAAMSPCPCGYLGDECGQCGCSGDRVAAYRARISGPLLDRIDLCIEVGRPARELLRGPAPAAEKSVVVQRRIVAARERALVRDGICNARLPQAAAERSCTTDDAGWRLLDAAAERFGLSVRACQRILRVARTIADLAGMDRVATAHVAEAISLRGLEYRGRRG
jgi:magnesium chelatase family protein